MAHFFHWTVHPNFKIVQYGCGQTGYKRVVPLQPKIDNPGRRDWDYPNAPPLDCSVAGSSHPNGGWILPFPGALPFCSPSCSNGWRWSSPRLIELERSTQKVVLFWSGLLLVWGSPRVDPGCLPYVTVRTGPAWVTQGYSGASPMAQLTMAFENFHSIPLGSF